MWLRTTALSSWVRSLRTSCEKYHIKYTPTPLGQPTSNGMADRYVQYFKQTSNQEDGLWFRISGWQDLPNVVGALVYHSRCHKRDAKQPTRQQLCTLYCCLHPSEQKRPLLFRVRNWRSCVWFDPMRGTTLGSWGHHWCVEQTLLCADGTEGVEAPWALVTQVLPSEGASLRPITCARFPG